MNMKNLISISGVGLLAVLACLLASATVEAQVGKDRGDDTERMIDRVDGWISDLGGPDYAKRESAHQKLKQLPEDDLVLLARYYRHADDFETRIRIEEIAIQAFFIRSLPDVTGFLGVSAPEVYSRMDSRVPRGMTGFKISHVVPGSSAEVIGLRLNDLIVAIDGETFLEGADFRALANQMRIRRAGMLMRLDFYRGYGRKSVRFPLGADTRRNPDTPGTSDEARPGLDSYQRAVRAFPTWWATHFEPKTEVPGRDRSTTHLPGFQNPQSPEDDRSPPAPKEGGSEKRE